MKALLLNTLGLWFLYRIAMWMKKHRAEIESKGKAYTAMAYAFVGIGYVLDVLYNMTWGSLMFMSLPGFHALTFSARLKYIRRFPHDYSWAQRALADFFCEKMLNPYDPSGKHC